MTNIIPTPADEAVMLEDILGSTRSDRKDAVRQQLMEIPSSFWHPLWAFAKRMPTLMEEGGIHTVTLGDGHLSVMRGNGSSVDLGLDSYLAAARE